MDLRTPVCATELQDVWSLYRHNSMIKGCTSVLKSCLMTGGIEVEGGFVGDTEIYKDLAAQAMDWLLCVGIIPMTCKSLDSGQWIPVIPDYSAVILYVQTDECGELIYSGEFKHGKLCSEKNLVVWASGNFGPGSNGRIRTQIPALMEKFDFMRFMASRCMIAEKLRSNPIVVTEETKMLMSEVEGINIMAQGAEEIDRLKTLEEIQNKHSEMYSHKWRGGVPHSADEFEEFERECEIEHKALPVERKVANKKCPELHSSCRAHLNVQSS